MLKCLSNLADHRNEVMVKWRNSKTESRSFGIAGRDELTHPWLLQGFGPSVGLLELEGKPTSMSQAILVTGRADEPTAMRARCWPVPAMADRYDGHLSRVGWYREKRSFRQALSEFGASE
jgi:hypothetical protein